MAEPIVFISVSRIVERDEATLRRALSTGAERIAAAKPRTAMFAAYVDAASGVAAGGELRIVHAFRDAAAMTSHFEGAQDRTRAAASLLRPVSFEVYGDAPSASVSQLADEAAGAGGTLRTWRPITGFLRPPTGNR